MLIKLGYHLSILLVFCTFPHPTCSLLVAPRSAAGVFFWLNWLQVCVLLRLLYFFFILFPSKRWVLVKSWHFCFQLLFSTFGFSCSVFVSSIWFLLWGFCLTFMFSAIILRFSFLLFSFCLVDYGFCCTSKILLWLLFVHRFFQTILLT